MRRLLALIACLGAVAPMGRAQAPVAPGPVAGRVLAADTGAPLRNARVQPTIANETPATVFTDAEGRFLVSAIVGPVSRVSVSKPGYLATTVAMPRAGDIDVRLTKASAIAGRIADTAGDPVVGMTVTAETPAATESARRTVATAQTDDLGDYRLAGLPAGSYVVRVNAPSWLPGGLRTETRVYYPGLHASAQSIAVSAGEERWAIDFLAPAATELGGTLGRSVAFPAGGSGGIRGRVTAADGRALPTTRVRVSIDGFVRSGILTDEEGRYEFPGLTPGTHTILADRPGFVTTAYGQRGPTDGPERIELREGDTRHDVDIKLHRLSAVVGRVVDDGGDPVEGAGVNVLRIRYVEGRRRLVDAGGQGTHRTDDRGVYRIYGLPPDDYVVSVTVGQLAKKRSPDYVLEPTADLPGYTTSYHPGTATPGEARLIVAALGQDVSGIDVALLRAPTARIAGTIVDASGNPIREGLILTPSRRSGVLAGSLVGAEIDAAGRFEFLNVAPGEYVVQAIKGDHNPFDEGESVSQFVTVAGGDVTGLSLRMSRGSTVRGSFTFEGSVAPDYFSVDIQAVAVDRDRTPQNLDTVASMGTQPDGTFEAAGLSGPRVFRLTGPDDVALKAVLLNGVDVIDTPLNFGTARQSIDGLEIVLTDKVSEVAGKAVDARGRPVADATVIVFSTDRARWGEASRFIASARAGRDGAFSVRNLPPGDYHAAAVTQAAPDEWRDPDLLDALLPGATDVTVSEGATVTTTVRAVTR